MNTRIDLGFPGAEDEAICELLREAGDCHAPPSAEHLTDLRRVLSSRLILSRPKRAWMIRRKQFFWIAGGAGAAAACAVALVVLEPLSVWAQVVRSVEARPWIHGTANGHTGKLHEFWLSLPREVSAARHGDHLSYDDWRAGIRYEFETQKKQLIRRPLNDDGTFESIAGVFRAIFRGEDARVGDILEHHLIIEKQRRSVHEAGRNWLEYVWTLARSDNRRSHAVLRVDPDAKLPVFLQLAADKESVTYDFDYPSNGPEDVYALGVPRDARMDDRIPSLEVSRIQRTVAAGQKDLDNYFAVVYDNLQFAHLIWRKGDKWREESSLRREDAPPLRKPRPGEDMVLWWKDNLKHMHGHPFRVCDGSQVFEYERPQQREGSDAGKWKWIAYAEFGKRRDGARLPGLCSNLIELEVYPEIGSAGRFVGETDATKATAGPGLPPNEQRNLKTLFEVNSGFARNAQSWLDPDHGFAVVRSKTHFPPDPTPQKNAKVASIEVQVEEFDEFKRTPRGIWYPTLVRRKSQKRDGTPVLGVLTTHFAIDFNSELPDKLFTPTNRE